MTGMAVSRGTLEAICLKQKHYHEPESLNICIEQSFTILDCQVKKEIHLFFIIATKLEGLCYNLDTCFVIVESLRHIPLFVTPWTIACQTSLSMGLSREVHWSGLPCPSPGDLPNWGTEPRFPTLQADSLPSEPPGKPKNTGVGSLSILQGILLTQE